MSTLLVVMPSTMQAVLKVADNTLIYDGHDFVEPADAKYVMLYTVSIAALNLPFVNAQLDLETKSYVRAAILRYDPISVTPTDPSIEAAPDPSLGTCICFITCHGTNIAYVKVTINPS